MKQSGILALALITVPVPALAQAYQCQIPVGPISVPPVKVDGERVLRPPRSFALAVSWSPEFCRDSHDAGSLQCSGRAGRFGFVVHGLWPEAGEGPAPQWCAPVPAPSPETVRRNLCMTPVPWLIAHEWAKHGSCMSASADDYYRTTAMLWERLRWPDADALSRRPGLTVGTLRDAIMVANPTLRRDAIGVQLSDNGWLRELRICYSPTWRAQPCGRRAFGAPDSAGVKIWRGI